MKIFLRVLSDFRFFLGNWKYYSIFIFGLIISFIWVAEPFFFSRILWVVEEFLKTQVLDTNKLIWQTILWIIFILVSMVSQYIYRYYFADKNILKFYVHLLQKNADKALQISYGSYLWKKQWETYKRLERWRASIFHFLFFLLLDTMGSFAGIFIIMIIMLFINIPMTLITFSLFPIAIFIWVFFNSKTIQFQKDINSKEDKVLGELADGLTNFSLLKILGLEKSISKSFFHSMDYILWKQFSVSKRWGVATLYTRVLIMFLRVIVLLSWIYFMQKGTLNLAELFLFFSYIWWIYFPLWAMFWQLRNVQEWWVGIEKFYKEFEDEIEFEDLTTWKTLTNPTWNISFENVSFGYTDDRKILKNISLNIEPGEKIALVGNTGAGKSTIVNLLLRFWDIEQGSIKLDWTDIRELKKSSLRSHIGVVSQDNSLFNLSIEENLKFANPKATKKDIEQALKNAEAEFVYDLKDWIKTVIWERGLKLSGGEKQRISIARLFLKNPEILILDEATSALDNVTEKKIEKALKKLMKNKTSIIIAHRLSTIQHVDRIFVLENGKIVESGNYETLMKNKKKFYNLANPDKLILW